MASVDLLITTLDQNDNQPVFSRPSYMVYIDELADIMPTKTIIRVTDSDDGVNSLLNFFSEYFRLVPEGSPDAPNDSEFSLEISRSYLAQNCVYFRNMLY